MKVKVLAMSCYNYKFSPTKYQNQQIMAKNQNKIPYFYASAASARRGHRVFGLSVHQSEDQVKIFVQGRISRPINGSMLIFHEDISLWDQQEYARAMTSWPIFHSPLTSDFGQIIKVFVQGRISRPINDSNLIFHMRMYLYETSRNIQEPWPPDQYFMVHWLWTFGQIIKVKIFVQGRISRPIDSSNLIFHMRMYRYETSRNIQEPWPPDQYFMVHWLWTFGQIIKVKIFVQGRISRPINSS